MAEIMPDAKLVLKTLERRECAKCGEPATNRNTYLLPKARVNPASNGYRQDDLSWCADHEQYLCGDCQPSSQHGAGAPGGYEWCATFSFGERFAHMFFKWVERDIAPDRTRADVLAAKDAALASLARVTT